MVLFVSHSGNTNECVVAAQQLAARSVPVLVLTGGKVSLAMNAAYTGS